MMISLLLLDPFFFYHIDHNVARDSHIEGMYFSISQQEAFALGLDMCPTNYHNKLHNLMTPLLNMFLTINTCNHYQV